MLAAEPASATPTTTALDTVGVTSTISSDITSTTAGVAVLQEFATNVAEVSPETAAKTPAQLQADYRVLQVDMKKVHAQASPGIPCTDVDGYANAKDVLVAPRGATGIRYEVDEDQARDPNYNPTLATNRCNLNIFWEEADTGDLDDPDASTATAPYTSKYASDCFARKRYYDNSFGSSVYASYNDACYGDYIVKYDGNPSWNYFTVKNMSSCKNYKATRLTSCGHGIQPYYPTSKGTRYWDDWAPTSDSTGDCRSKSVSVSAGPISVSGDYTHCEVQKIYKYAEAGKMSSYWKGMRDGTRATQHQVSVRYPQTAGYPHWSHWLNSDACLACVGTK
ncbi:hypothetical protein ABZ456_31960 [Streptomyces sp. NPDC005776]|uniref:hypothetical protein n=1 Tax=Streptomyces sp. NPDC005776 TaxID=3154676 RepID=UPI0033DDDC47